MVGRRIVNNMLNNILDNSYFQNVVSEFIALVILLILGWSVHKFTHRSQLLRFFRVADSKRVVVYLSNLSIPKGGAIDIDGIPRSFQESAVPAYETRLPALFQRLFNFIVPGADSLPGFLKSILVSDVSVEILVSPLSENEVERDVTLITFGGPGYNIVSRRIEQTFHSFGKFTPDGGSIVLQQMSPLNDPRCAFVQRVIDQTTGQQGFYVAGISSLATTGAAYFLATQWRFLAKKYSNDRPFCVMLRVASADARQYEILFEKG